MMQARFSLLVADPIYLDIPGVFAWDLPLHVTALGYGNSHLNRL